MITSNHNPKIQRVRALLTQRREREREGVLVVEGVRLTEEAYSAGWQAELVLFTSDLSARGQELLGRFQTSDVEVEEVPPSLLKSLADTETPQGILVVFKQRQLPLPDQLNFIVIADELRDPGNLGTLLRSSAAAGAQALILTPGSADVFSPKVVRSGMGAHFRLPVRVLDAGQIDALCHRSTPALNLYLAEAAEGTPCWDLNLRRPCALVVGGEANGASPAVRAVCDGQITIPMPGKSESLNAAVAASILLFEVVRQRK